MPFQLTEQHITDYYHHGYTVFQAILPPSLTTELRLAGEEVYGLSKAARSPVLSKLFPKLSGRSVQAFRDYGDLPPLVDAIHRVLTPGHSHCAFDQMSIFYTLEAPACGDWHRDIGENYKGVVREEFAQLKHDPTFFAQVNCALYTDTCLWYVPGSAGRANTPGELAAAGPPYDGIEGRGKLIDFEGKSYVERERMAIEYCRGMPGAVNLVLEAGDFALYRPIGWHNGNYAPHRKRMTLHHVVSTPKLLEWFANWAKRRAA